jgi:hypothetical protein
MRRISPLCTTAMLVAANLALNLDKAFPGRIISVNILRAMRGRKSLELYGIRALIHSFPIAILIIVVPLSSPVPGTLYKYSKSY